MIHSQLLLYYYSVYELRPKPYGVELTNWTWDEETDTFKVLEETTQ